MDKNEIAKSLMQSDQKRLHDAINKAARAYRDTTIHISHLAPDEDLDGEATVKNLRFMAYAQGAEDFCQYGTPENQRAWIKDRLGMCEDNIEGTNLKEFLRWEALAEAYRVILEDMEAESEGREIDYEARQAGPRKVWLCQQRQREYENVVITRIFLTKPSDEFLESISSANCNGWEVVDLIVEDISWENLL